VRADEQDALERLTDAFPGSRILPFEPHPQAPLLAEADEVLEEEARSSSWAPVDLREHLHEAGGHDAPSLLRRTDGQALIYAHKRNELHGPYDSGKSWVAQWTAREVLAGGGVVVWLDFEDSPRSVALRMVALGATEDEIVQRFRYIQPAEPLTQTTEIDLRLALAGARLVVIDAANEAMAAAGLDPNANRDIAQWYAKVPRIATDCGATVLVLDHVAKDPDRQRGAVGGAHKQVAIDGASYRIDTVKPFGRGSAGMVRLRLTKDRGGYIRGTVEGREPTIAEIAIDSTDPEALVVEVRPPAGPEWWRPTHLMEAVSRLLEDQAEALSERAIVELVSGKQTYVREALATLVREGYVQREGGPRGAHLHSSTKPFREDS
jgi:AAA domain